MEDFAFLKELTIVARQKNWVFCQKWVNLWIYGYARTGRVPEVWWAEERLWLPTPLKQPCPALVPAHGTWQCCPLSSSSTCRGQEELNLSNFPPHTHTDTHSTSYRCLNCWGFVHLVQFIANNSGSRFPPPLGTPFLSLAAEPDPGASRIEPQEVPTASSRLRIPSWVLNALHQRAVGHHINQELWNPPRHLVGNGYRVLASLKHNLKDFGVILRLFLSFSPVSM